MNYKSYLKKHKDHILKGYKWLIKNLPYLFVGNYGSVLSHHGIKGQKRGVRNGPPYPLGKEQSHNKIIDEAIKSGEVLLTVNKDKQRRHTKSGHIFGRSYLDGDEDFAQRIIDELHGTGTPVIVEGQGWKRKERVTAIKIIGTYVDPKSGVETKTNKAMIVYSKTGSHIYPRKENDDG